MTLLGYPAIAPSGISGLIGAELLTAFDLEPGFRPAGMAALAAGFGRHRGAGAAGFRRRRRHPARPAALVNTLLDGKPCRLVGRHRGAAHPAVRPSAQRLGYWSDSRPYRPTVTPDLFGERLGSSRLVRADEITLGSIRIAAPELALQDPTAPGAEGLDGLLGLDLIRQLSWTVDVKGSAVWAAAASDAAPGPLALQARSGRHRWPGRPGLPRCAAAGCTWRAGPSGPASRS